MTSLGIKVVSVPDAALKTYLEERCPILDFILWKDEEDPSADDLSVIDAVITPYAHSSLTVERLASLPNLKLVQTQSTGMDNLVGKVPPGVVLCSARGVHAASTAELAVGLVIASLRGIDVAARNMTRRVWQEERRLTLTDRKVALLGYGSIGQELHRKLAAFDVEIVRIGQTARRDEHGDIHGMDDLMGLLPQTDILISSLPMTPRTVRLINRPVLSAMKDGALFINVGRGGVVDQDALAAELYSGRISAAVDVTDPEPLPEDHPLWSAPHFLLTPHLGGNTSAFLPRIRTFLADQMKRIAGDQPVMNQS
ncbi:2-hydroxyacid dehydrogenase [Gluconacetobacter azotocaptans]|uniref:2-hydroxyacid dehydrogenase n=1 Tax=Gluconacetobacter azotocaptans TaxID=142834 RepID=A0A7W4JQF4_9PROT|nr:2-hydroxyacid dehydrogenase [Gluconacetobacter azotocaptans]MBB2189032.1 2-hydroxyacid dehydrogenase [Gluconacetobacter azotocaptans]